LKTRFFRFFCLFAFIAVLRGAGAADVSGTWKGAFDFQGSSIALTIHLKIDGTAVTGTVEGLPTTTAEIHEGTLSGDTVSFWVNSDYEGQIYKLVYKGKVADNQISFNFGTEDGSWSSPFTVMKSPGDTPAVPASADVTGSWKGAFDFQGTNVPVTFHLKGSGAAVTGTIAGMGPAPVEVHEGKVDGDTVTFWVNSDYEGQTYTLVYKGNVAADQIDFNFGTADQSWGSTVTAKKSTEAAPAPAATK
jgi:riboflavin synthase alpha subunit